MRQIKFRAWDKQSKIWRYFSICDISNIKENDWRFSDFENWCEYTGLHDKNGKEIYEGDIVESLDKMFGGDGSRNRRVVTFEDGCFQLDGTNLYIITQVAPNGLSFEPEIIGNIYENPELIK